MQHLTKNITLNLVRHASRAASIAVQNIPQKLGPISSIGSQTIVSSNQFPRNYASKTNPQNLPHFPAFPLDETMKKFLKSIEPLLTEAELKETKKEAELFLKGEGAKLQCILQNEASKSENWLSERWLKAAYLQYRDPVTIYSSPAMCFVFRKFSSDDDWLKYASKAAFIALKYKELVDNKKIPVEKMGKNQLDMSQYEKVFGTCRIPGSKEDTMMYNPTSKHIAVAYKGHWFSCCVYSGGKIFHPDLILKQFKEIVCKVSKAADNPVGILSTHHRDEWAKAYTDLMCDATNKESVKSIQTSLFTVALDSEVPVKYGENEKSVVSEQLIHGGGSKQNAGNRWMDKTIQLCVNRSGVNGFCYEHSPAEGQPVAITTDFILKNIDNSKITENTTTKDYKEPKPLTFNMNDKLCKHIKDAKTYLDKMVSGFKVCVLHYKGYGREFIKTQKLGPDSYIQMAMQYAFYRYYKIPAAQYESAHLRIYPGGRTETIRSCSSESLAFAKSMVDKAPDDERVKKLKAAVNGHQQYTRMALEGKGCDRHLLGLKLMAIENKIPVPKFFSTPGYVKSMKFRVSTSQVASKFETFMAFGPSQPNGYGCCYNPRADDIIISVSNWSSNKETDSTKFAVTLKESFDEMQALLTRAGEKPKAKM